MNTKLENLKSEWYAEKNDNLNLGDFSKCSAKKGRIFWWHENIFRCEVKR